MTPRAHPGAFFVAGDKRRRGTTRQPCGVIPEDLYIQVGVR